MSSGTTGKWSRIGENRFGLGLKRYEDGDKNGLWRLTVTKGDSKAILIELDVVPSDLREIETFCGEARTILCSDGGRIVSDMPIIADGPHDA